MKLFCFPWSGGSSVLFLRYAKMLGDGFDMIPFDPDIDESLSFKENIISIAGKILEQTEKSEKMILFGHSMGAVIAFETAKVIAEKESCSAGLVISGMLPPSKDLLGQLDSELDRDKAKKYSAELGMKELDMLPDSFLDTVIDKMNKENRFLKGYESCGNKKLDMPAAVMFSEQESQMASVDVWDEFFAGDIEHISVSGKHFYLKDDFTPVSDAIKLIGRRLEEKEE